jgi:hypothetical protein
MLVLWFGFEIAGRWWEKVLACRIGNYFKIKSFLGKAADNHFPSSYKIMIARRKNFSNVSFNFINPDCDMRRI